MSSLYRMKMFKERYCFEQGTFLANRIADGQAVNLYGLGDFYVEVFYDVEQNEIIELRPFRSDGLLAPYFAQIKLDLA